MKWAGWIVAVCLMALVVFVGQKVDTSVGRERERWGRERDSLNAVNASLRARVDSLIASAQQRAMNSDSLASVPRIIYIEHAARLTHSASLDSLGLLLGADPFTAVPDTFIRDDER